MTTNEDLRRAAETHIQSYANACQILVNNSSATTKDLAEALISHNTPGSFQRVIFGQGEAMLMSSPETVAAFVKYADRWIKMGFGLDIRLEKQEIHLFSPTSAHCYLTWRVHPPAGASVQSWNWENMYMFRLPPGSEKGFWEGVICDNEIASLIEKDPGFMEAMAG